eukprot:TRINITY_DN6190_c0_g1_i1.p1 TRINITY_DN6190_c0_g1~~TRINITY_DN6190_c0_g1_i1.p1  ORF type:complete len:535 (-),score=149.62 TRINITY_DN6190_c0_g1_i1:81-1685(-)
MAGVGEEETVEEMDKGPMTYQESKDFHSEPHLLNVYDSTTKRVITFESYGLDTQAMLYLMYDYQAFDNLFRFNAELMNPNRKEGRFHFVIERLVINVIGGDRKLQLGEKPTEETSQLPIYETVRKIPTGRMDLKERQRLREQMDMLDIRRAENIARKRLAARERFMKHVTALKEDAARRKEEQDRKMEEERQFRYKSKEDQEKKDEEELKTFESKARVRRKAVELREQRTEEQEEFELARLRLRWKASDAEKARVMAAAREKLSKQQAADREQAEQLGKKREDAKNARAKVWAIIDGTVKARQDAWLQRIFEAKADKAREEKMRVERKREYVEECLSIRHPIFAAQLRRFEERNLAREAEGEAVTAYQDGRRIAPKEKTKGSFAKNKKVEEKAPERPKKTKKDDDAKAKEKEKEDAGVDVEKVLDAVESKMRAEMEEERRRARLETMREEKIQKITALRQEKECEHMKDVREDYRQMKAEQDRVAEERRIVIRHREEEAAAAADRRKTDLERLERIRQANIERIEKNALAAACR